ncbi:hypothetical protein LINPERPRIM_LOCUS31224 [Linum perenne]
MEALLRPSNSHLLRFHHPRRRFLNPANGACTPLWSSLFSTPPPITLCCSQLLPDASGRTVCFPGELFAQQATEKDMVPPPSLKPAKSRGGKQLCSGYD